jgi:hypothetical protein
MSPCSSAKEPRGSSLLLSVFASNSRTTLCWNLSAGCAYGMRMMANQLTGATRTTYPAHSTWAGRRLPLGFGGVATPAPVATPPAQPAVRKSPRAEDLLKPIPNHDRGPFAKWYQQRREATPQDGDNIYEDARKSPQRRATVKTQDHQT